MSLALRALGALCPTAFGLDHRIMGRLHRRGLVDPNDNIRAGNGFYMTGETRNAAYISGVSERAYMKALAGLMRPGSTVYNVGANAGYLALWLGTHFGDRGEELRFVAFEPDPGTADLLRRNVTLNPHILVRVEGMALGDTDGAAVLHSAGAGDGAASLLPRAGAAVNDVSISVARLDTYQQQAQRKPHWLVLDVEGFGAEVIRGGIKTIASCRPAIAAEIHSPAELDGMHLALANLGYARTMEHNDIWGRHAVWLPQHSP